MGFEGGEEFFSVLVGCHGIVKRDWRFTDVEEEGEWASEVGRKKLATAQTRAAEEEALYIFRKSLKRVQVSIDAHKRRSRG
jgi:hypothetical protein